LIIRKFCEKCESYSFFLRRLPHYPVTCSLRGQCGPARSYYGKFPVKNQTPTFQPTARHSVNSNVLALKFHHLFDVTSKQTRIYSTTAVRTRILKESAPQAFPLYFSPSP
jgi:hypothetical protein